MTFKLNRNLSFVTAGLLAFAILSASPALQAQSSGQPARAVRLSYVDGKVQLVQGGQPLANQAVINAPLFEGTQIVTGDDGKAEVQFEDGSVARVSPASSLTLTTLSSSATNLTLDSGLAYFELQSSGQFGPMNIAFADGVVTASGFTILRINMDTPPGAIAVFSGNAHIDRGANGSGWAGSVDLHSGQSAAFNGADAASPNLGLVERGSRSGAERGSILPDTGACRSGRSQRFESCLERSGRQRQLVQRARTGLRLVSVRCRQPGLRPLRQRRMDADAGLRLRVGLRLRMGLPALPVRHVEFLRQLWMGMGARIRRLQPVVGRRLLRWAALWHSSHRLSAAALTDSRQRPRAWTGSSNSCEPDNIPRQRSASRTHQKCAGNHRRPDGAATAHHAWTDIVSETGDGKRARYASRYITRRRARCITR